MSTAKTLRTVVLRALIVTTTSALLPAPTHAEMIDSGRAANGERDRILVLLERPEVAAQLEAYGVKPDDAKARVAALSEKELARLSAEIEEGAAGAGGGNPLAFLVVAVFILFLPLFILGALIVKGAGKSAVSTQGAVDETQSRFPG